MFVAFLYSLSIIPPPPKKKNDFDFRVKHILKKTDIKNLIFFLFLFHGLSFDILEKNGGHKTNYLSGGTNLTPTPQI